MKIKVIVVAMFTFITFGCTTVEKVSKKDAFPKMYEEKPLSLLVIPIINNTTAADAPILYNATLKQPLSEHGYYVLPIEYTQQVLKEQGIINGTLARNVPLKKYQEFFGADAVLFITVNAWDTDYTVVASTMTVSSEFSLYSTETNTKIWGYNNATVINLTGNSGDLLVDLISTAISTAVTDYVPIAQKVNQEILLTLPRGHYHELHGKDGLEKFYGALISFESNENNLSAKEFSEPPKGMSNIYIYRKPSTTSLTQGIKRGLWIDKSCIGDTASSSFFKIQVKTNESHNLSTESEYSNNDIRIELSKDGNYFYEQEFTMGMTVPVSNLVEIEEEVAINDIKILSLAKNGKCSANVGQK